MFNPSDLASLNNILGVKLLKKIKPAENQRVLRSKSGDGGSRTLVQTRNPHGFYMLIPLLVFVPRKGTNALNATLSPKASPCCRSADKAIPKLLSTPGSGRNQESPPAGCLVPSPCEGIKPVIYCASIRQRERSCFRQLIFCSQDLRASLRGSTCLHDNSSCCQNHTSPSFSLKFRV